ncbi:MAG: S8 family serine peptidase [Phycisphaerales bacterium]|nr:S8 family serine peptidase [Phycisphaerales bacterium]
MPGPPARAADPARPEALRLRVGDVVPARSKTSAKADALVIQLTGPLTRDVRRELDDLGVELLAYLPPHAYLARIASAEVERVRALPAVVEVGAYARDWRICPDLADLSATVGSQTQRVTPRMLAYRQRVGSRRAALAELGRVQLAIAALPGEVAADLTARVAAVAGCRVLRTTVAGERTFLDVEAPADALSALAAVDGVQFIEDAPAPVERNAVTAPFLQSGAALTPYWDVALQGEDQIVGMIDSTPRITHCMFSDSVAVGPDHRKFVYTDPDPLSSAAVHGTFVAGVLAGDMGTWGVCEPGDGLACAARIAYTNLALISASPASLYDHLQADHDAGAAIHTNSWGDDGSTAYTIWCHEIDAFSYDHEYDAVIFAETNTSLLRTPENAKNVLAVGASLQYPNQDSHCYGGAGPTADGRRKPEVFAPGCGVRSAASSTPCGTQTGSGTSYAAPAVAAAAALVRQYFVDGFYPNGARGSGPSLVPTGALLRAALINSATDMALEPGYPSNVEGWGVLGLHRTLYLADRAPGAAGHRRLVVRDVPNAAGLATGETLRLHVGVWDEAEPLRITLVFTDPPGAVGAADPVVNDLDLIVTAPDGSTYYGNVFSSGVSVAGGFADNRNTVEQVLIAAPLAGAYTVDVFAREVNSPADQGCAVVITGDVLEIASTLPIASGAGAAQQGAVRTAFADHDSDGDCDLRDFAAFQACYTGPLASYADPSCSVFDADADGDIDGADHRAVQFAQTPPAH